MTSSAPPIIEIGANLSIPLTDVDSALKLWNSRTEPICIIIR